MTCAAIATSVDDPDVPSVGSLMIEPPTLGIEAALAAVLFAIVATGCFCMAEFRPPADGPSPSGDLPVFVQAR